MPKFFISVEPSRINNPECFDPAIVIRRSRDSEMRDNTFARRLKIVGSVQLIVDRDVPLRDGTRAWIETDGPVWADGKLMT